jgi:hypothetical protein
MRTNRFDFGVDMTKIEELLQNAICTLYGGFVQSLIGHGA